MFIIQESYSAFTDKVGRRNCHFLAPGRNYYCFYGAILDSYRERRVAFGGESCGSCREPGSQSVSTVSGRTYFTLSVVSGLSDIGLYDVSGVVSAAVNL
jgi:hypothetical protein